MYKLERGAVVWRKHVMTHMKPDSGSMREKEALASGRRVKFRLVHFVQTVTFKRPCLLKELSEGQSESPV